MKQRGFKIIIGLALLLAGMTGCSHFQGGDPEPVETSRDTIREEGTTGFGVGSDTATQTGIDTGTRTGSGLR